MVLTQVEWFRVDPGTGPTIQDQINAAAAANGGIVYLAPGDHLIGATLDLPYPWTPPPPSDWYYNPLKPISLLGDGANATTIKRAPGFTAGPMLRAKRPFSTISGITFDGTGGTSGPVIETTGIVQGGAVGNTRWINFRDCIIKNGPLQCLNVLGGPSGSPDAPISILCNYDRCTFANNGATALVEIGERCTTHEFRNCVFTSFRGNAVRLNKCQGVSLYDCLFDTAKDGGTQPYLRGDEAIVCQVVNCIFDEGTDPVTARQWFIDLSTKCDGWSIVGPLFIRRSTINSLAMAVRIGNTALGPCYGIAILDPVIRMPAGIVGTPGLHIDVQNPAGGPYSECVILGGFVEVGEPPLTTKYPLSLTDASNKTAWLGHRRWRLPQVTTAENPSSGQRLGDLLSRPGRGLEAWNGYATAPGPSWIPLTVNRYADQAALGAVAATSINLGSLAWVDNDDGMGNGALRVCTAVGPPHTWKKVTIV